MKEIYLAGGCFWGMEHVIRALDGVVHTETGYANGTVPNPSYEQVCSDTTGHRETVRVVYNPGILPLSRILRAFFICVDPTQKNRQGNDIGSQYQTGIYTSDPDSEREVAAYLEHERKLYPEFHVESGALKQFWPAEEYHQNYLLKHPDGYCHISRTEYQLVRQLNETEESE